MIHFTISARGKPGDVPIRHFLTKGFPSIPVVQIDSVFGFVERSTLYGGRIFEAPELTARDVEGLYELGIGLRIPLTNHIAQPEEYESNLSFLQKYHRPRNAVIVTNDSLARWIRRDFPDYRIEASVIKNVKTHARIAAALNLYDTVVLPMELNQDEEFLAQAENKDRITLFANAGCALTCPSRICYLSISQFNKNLDGELRCSQDHKQRDIRGMIDFDLDRLQELGFSRFKMLRARPGGFTGY